MHKLEKIVKNYYELVGCCNYTAMYDLFDHGIIYHREGTKDINGIDAFRKFYEEDRVILFGEHKAMVVETDSNTVNVTGVFEGILKNGDKVKVRFKDIFVFNSHEKIISRTTLFPDGGGNLKVGQIVKGPTFDIAIFDRARVFASAAKQSRVLLRRGVTKGSPSQHLTFCFKEGIV